ncbi:striatin-interacting protein 1-like isoform X2 [Artemia franciscana]|uniref:Uncharacterized protein n=1 Tax=Artemia franciscana TaxID=6661 RepID=A0AA88IF39_ARTSF|nr:hypothetical protein QYM36_007712 [Artemia franciscana]
MDEVNSGRRGPPKLREILRRQRQDSECGSDCPDIDFVYDDSDSYANEIAELYTYTEVPEFQLNLKAFEETMTEFGMTLQWMTASPNTRKTILMKLSDRLELTSKLLRMKAARAVLYIAQGCWGEVQSDAEQQEIARKNCILLYRNGIFHIFIELLNLEAERARWELRRLAICLSDSTELRVILSVLYTIVESIRIVFPDESDEEKSLREEFKAELGQPIGDELLAVSLLGLVTRFCSGTCPYYPMKKVLLLLWKILLFSLGGTVELKDLKNEKRKYHGLPPCMEDTVEVAKTMRASSPPANAADLIEVQNQAKGISRPFRRSSLDESLVNALGGIDMDGTEASLDDEMAEIEERRALEEAGEIPQPPSPRPTTPMPKKALPWSTKVREKDIDIFLNNTRMKFVGYHLSNDRESLAGLPQPIHEGISVLKQHVYKSLAEIQIKREDEILQHPLSKGNEEIQQTHAELLYQAMLPSLPQHMIALLKILLATAPTSKAKTDSINIMTDVLPDGMPITVVQSMRLGVDVNRHKEIIVKAVSAILLLLLKHFKLNHIYQFEFMSQHLVFANCIPLVLKFFNQNVLSYVTAKNAIAILDFPSCVIGDQPDLTTETLEIGVSQPYCWRNLFACINLLRILNKLTKWKNSRIMMLVVFKSAPILKRALKVKHSFMQLYVLKILKMQTKYLGRQWRKSNMKTLSAIYQKVRHRLNDDWAYGNEMDARPWDFQVEECNLRLAVERFNTRRYDKSGAAKDPDFEPVDNWLPSVLNRPMELTESFKRHYELWLNQEVYHREVDWDQLLSTSLL